MEALANSGRHTRDLLGGTSVKNKKEEAQEVGSGFRPCGGAGRERAGQEEAQNISARKIWSLKTTTEAS
jgi:hypothetical protein